MVASTPVLPHSSSALDFSEPAVGPVQGANATEAGPATAKPGTLRSFAAETVRETLELAEKAQQAGRNHVELRVQTSDTEDVRIHLRWNQGTLHAKFVTHSHELNQALAREWESLMPRLADKGMKFSEPSFERNEQHSGQSADQNASPGSQHRQQARDDARGFSFEESLAHSARPGAEQRRRSTAARTVDPAPAPTPVPSPVSDRNLQAWA